MDKTTISDALIKNAIVPRGFIARSVTRDKIMCGAYNVVGESFNVCGTVGDVTVAVSVVSSRYDGRVWIDSAAGFRGWCSATRWCGWMPGITAAIKEGL